jgi:undecaprenyl-diphosphatase
MLDNLVSFTLKMGNGDVIASAIVLGILFHYRKEDFERAACFVCFVMIFNTLLKNIFKIPLFPHLGHGYAFPSGHMHVAAVFYGYFLYRTRSHAVQAILISILGCVASSIVYRHFHDWYDIIGAVMFTSLEITSYHILKEKYGAKVTDIVAIFAVFVVFCALRFVYGAKSYNWLALYVFSGIILGKRLCRGIVLTEWSQKLVAVFIWAGITVIVHFSNKVTGIQMNKMYCIRQFKYFLFAITIYSSIWIAATIIKSNRKGLPEKQEY